MPGCIVSLSVSTSRALPSKNRAVSAGWTATLAAALFCLSSATLHAEAPKLRGGTEPKLQLRGTQILEGVPIPRQPKSSPSHGLRSSLSAHLPRFTRDDAIATFGAIDYALDKVSDGFTYVWHRAHGRLSALITLHGTFVSAQAETCRKLRIELVSTKRTHAVSGIACREKTGIWRLGTHKTGRTAPSQTKASL